MSHHTQPAPTIFSVADPFAPVGPHAVGEAEVILTAVEAELVQQDRTSLVPACAGSVVAGELIRIPAVRGSLTDYARTPATAHMQAQPDHAFRAQPIDLLHMRSSDFHLDHVPANIPFLVNLHLPSARYPEPIRHLPPHFHLVCASEQRQSFPAHARPRLRVLPRRVALPPAMPGPAACCPGAITGERKRHFLQAPQCVLTTSLSPSLAPETSSLLAMEALADGTTVVAERLRPLRRSCAPRTLRPASSGTVWAHRPPHAAGAGAQNCTKVQPR